MKVDVCVVGGGLVGLSVALALCDRLSGLSVAILEKEDRIAAHQSSHNSGVVHSGLYYRPGSLKARLCVEGRDATYELCQAEGIPHDRSGKLVIATEVSQLEALGKLERRGAANQLNGLERLGPAGIADHEPSAVGLAALYVPDAGVVDFEVVASHHAMKLRERGASVVTGAEVTRIQHRSGSVTIDAGRERYMAKALVNCAGLHSDRVALLAGVTPSVEIVPFRGEYYRLSKNSAELVRALIYPVPDPTFPFLGVHFTRRIDGTVEVGPNAVLAAGREHYRGSKPNWAELRSTLGYSGFRRLAARHWWEGSKELFNSRSKRRYARLARRLVPGIGSEDLLPGGAGVRAQAVDATGKLVDDFVIETAGSTVHILNAPSPGATASMAIGSYAAKQVQEILAG